MLKNFLASICILIVSCNNSQVQNTPVLTILEEKVFDSIPSGSGLALLNDQAIIISDDAPFVFGVSLNQISTSKLHIDGLDSSNYRIPKALKPDYESAFSADYKGLRSLFAVGSGSLGTVRDTLLLVNKTIQKRFSLTHLYDMLRRISSTANEQWNIEGSAILGDSLWLLNRGNNFLYSISWKDFTLYLDGKEFNIGSFYKFELPVISGHRARFSGICKLDETHALFSASVEDTDDWVNDGNILGSIFCIADITQRKIIGEFRLTDKTGKLLQEKIESVELLKKNSDGSFEIIAIADNDDGKTKMFRIRIGME